MVEVTVSFSSKTKTFRLIGTAAPRAADVLEAIEVYDASEVDKPWRYILVPVEDLDYQVGRNHSGLWNIDIESDDMDPGALETWIYDRLHGARQGDKQ